MEQITREFITRLSTSFEEETFVKLTLGHPHNAHSELRKLLFRPVLIRGEKRCSIVSRFATRDETANVPFAEALAKVEANLGSLLLSGHLFTEAEEVQLELGKKKKLRVTAASNAPATLGHDRLKTRWVDSHSPYLAKLGVTDASGKIRMSDKFRQIVRFVDLLSSAFRESELGAREGRDGNNGSCATSDSTDSHNSAPPKPLTLCDMGSGKGYLTFAAYDFFRRVARVPVAVTGVEARKELAVLCGKVAEECGFENLRFLQSTIEDFPLPKLDILLALHACNTATDDALAKGVHAGAAVILVAPCCHKEMREQVDKAGSHGSLRDVLRHGIFAERHAEIVTDALRALLLERVGYRVRVSEFVAAEHTAKNVMIIATRRSDLADNESRAAEIDRRISELKNFYGIQHHRLEDLLVVRR